MLDAAAIEFGERGFHEASVSSITRRAGVALGSFYTYFDSKEALFRALVLDMSMQVKTSAANAVASSLSTVPDPTAFDVEEAALAGFLEFASEHKEIYRIIDESEFVDPQTYREHYENTAERILERLRNGARDDHLRDDLGELHAWALMGMNVFLGLRYAVWARDDDGINVARMARDMLEKGIGK